MPVFAAAEERPPWLMAGRFTLATTRPTPPLTPQQIPGRPAAVAPEPPHPDQLTGRTAQARWGLAQPVFAPTRPVVARPEERPPEPGRMTRSVGGTPFDNRPVARPVVARGEGAPPAEGRFARGTVGFGVPRVPARPIVTAPEVRAFALLAGALVAARVPLPGATPQQPPGRVLVVRPEEPPPFPGACWIRVRPLVPSDRLPPRPMHVRGADAPPAEGRTLYARSPFGPNPPVRALLFAPEPMRPEPGRTASGKAPPPNLIPQQMPGRALLACAEPPWWLWDGRFVAVTGRLAGAVVPPLPSATPAKLFQRTDAGNRSFKRPTNVNALSYQTRTKTPGQLLKAVFDFSNQPELVAGATIVSAVVSGPGGAALSGLSAGTPSVLSAAAVIDSAGNTVAAGKGVEATLAGGGAGDDVIVECAATLSTGSVATVQGKVAVRNVV